MVWWRSRQRHGAGLALLALLVQIVVSFGHIHPEDFRPAAAATATASAAAHAQPGRSDPLPPGHPDDDCPICMAVHMAAMGLVTVPPAVAIPTEFSLIAHERPAAQAAVVARYVLFRTRAPPAA